MTEPIKSQVDFEARWTAQAEQLLLARARAIDAYAGVEHALSNLFSALIDVDQDIGTLVFYRVVNTRSRNEMMQDLITRVHGATYKRYWDSMFRFITKLDTQRNRIVHWHVAGIQEPALSHPKHFFFEDGGIPEVRLAEIHDFIERAIFVRKSVSVFWLMDTYAIKNPDGSLRAWLEIFLRPLTYPIPADHPLSRWMPGLKTQPPPSPG